MARRRLTQVFPWLLPLRRRQRLFCFYTAMRFDGNHYASGRRQTQLPYPIFSSSCPLYNRETGFDMIYQQNKVFNLKLAASAFSGIVIAPGQTFSLCRAMRGADRKTPYKDGLSVTDGKLTTARGGGLCQMSNLLFWAFLHTPLTIVERHGHAVKDFPEPPSDAPLGVDATISEGWLDLKVRNDTDTTYQIVVSFDEQSITGSILADRPPQAAVTVENGTPEYISTGGKIYEEVDIIQHTRRPDGDSSSSVLYRNRCEIRYPLPDDVTVIYRKDERS